MEPVMTDLRIASPCHESWSAMTPNHQGRHCAACDKTVVDVTALAPTAAHDYLRRELPRRIERGEKVCVRAHADRTGRLLRPGVTRRLLTNGLAAVLAMAAADFAGFTPGLGAAETSTTPTSEPLPGKMGEVEASPVKMGKVVAPIAIVSMGAVACSPPTVVEPITDPASGIVVQVDPATFVVTGSDAQGVVLWRSTLTDCGIPGDDAHRPSAMRHERGVAHITCGDRSVIVDIRSGTCKPFPSFAPLPAPAE